MYAFPSKGNGQMIKTDGMWKKGKIRVAKCHGYDGYIRAKKLASWGNKFGRTKNKQKQATFWKICATSVRPSGQTSMGR